MEVLHAFGVDWKILLIQVFNFGLVLLVLRRFLYAPVVRMLDERSAKLKRGLDDADAATKERKELAQAKEGIILEARREGSALIESLRKDALAKERELAHAAEERRTALMMDAKTKAEEERNFILRESEKDIARTAVLAAEKILKERA